MITRPVRYLPAWIVALAACVSNDPLQSGSPGPIIPIYQVENLVRSEWVLDPYQTMRVAVTGYRLSVDIVYAGGCREHTFQLAVAPDPSFALYPPPPRRLAVLGHDGQHDPCEAALSTSLEADLTPIGAAVDTTVFDLILLPPDDRGDTVTLRVGPGT